MSTGRARPCNDWACFHTTMYVLDVDGCACGIVPRTIGGPYAVLVAEQLRASGARIIVGLTSAGRVAPSLPVPSLVVATRALRDEGTSYHCLPPDPIVEARHDVTEALLQEARTLGLPVAAGLVWTTDAPYRETLEQLREHATAGALAVEMQAASLFSFGAARGFPTGVLAHVTNAIGHDEKFDKGGAQVGHDILLAICRASQRALKISVGKIRERGRPTRAEQAAMRPVRGAWPYCRGSGNRQEGVRGTPTPVHLRGSMRFVEEPDRADWHARGLDATKGADLHTRIDLLIAAGEIGRLADLIAGTTDDALQGFRRRSAERALLLSSYLRHTCEEAGH